MAASLLFYRSRDSEDEPAYFGAILSGKPYAIHYQMQLKNDGTFDLERWTAEHLSRDGVADISATRPPFEEPWPIDSPTFFKLLQRYILPPLPLSSD